MDEAKITLEEIEETMLLISDMSEDQQASVSTICEFLREALGRAKEDLGTLESHDALVALRLMINERERILERL